ncbi:MAG: hypothetical protein KA072_14790 [Thermoanaerobaculaceae bacterium]|nr:hypothetical protein [Thermoanaerobaculaceae bacterium]MDI9622933.1 hypothetical protein [Acidobacteriota bacterium]NLH09852.1 hypothetical protein [Holophagae bacterium]HPW56875.1 hypothetical protein [Thermoanaerobaculaceae bacterium]
MRSGPVALFLEGLPAWTGNVPTLPLLESAQEIWIGSEETGEKGFHGTPDEETLLGRALTACGVRRLHENHVGPHRVHHHAAR